MDCSCYDHVCCSPRSLLRPLRTPLMPTDRLEQAIGSRLVVPAKASIKFIDPDVNELDRVFENADQSRSISNSSQERPRSERPSSRTAASRSSDGLDPGSGSVTSSFASNFARLDDDETDFLGRDRERRRIIACWRFRLLRSGLHMHHLVADVTPCHHGAVSVVDRE